MKRFILIITVLFLLNASLKCQTMDALIMKAAITKLENAKDYTLKVADLMPEEKYAFKPTKEEMGFGEQLLHLSSNMGWLCSAYLGGSENPITKADATLQSKAEIRAVVVKAYDYALQTIKHFNPTQLSDTVKFFAGPMNKLQILTLLNDHQTHHRAQMLIYLRLNGLVPPSYVGW